MAKINNELRDACYDNACKHGFHDKKYSDEHWLMLIITEIGEAVNAHRSGNRASIEMYLDALKYEKYYREQNKEISDRHTRKLFEDDIKDTLEDELADIVIRCLDFAGLKGFDLPSLIGTVLYGMSFAEVMYNCVLHLNQSIFRTVDKHSIMLAISTVLEEARVLGIDLLWFIEQKMKYNETRAMLHGKEY